jgi:mRNA interferase MazF
LNRQIQRGDIYLADLRPTVGSEQSGVRPVLIVQNNVGNKYSPTVIAAAITSRRTKARLPTHVQVGMAPGMFPDSIIMLEQLRTLDKSRLLDYISAVQPDTMLAVNQAINISVGQDGGESDDTYRTDE